MKSASRVSEKIDAMADKGKELTNRVAEKTETLIKDVDAGAEKAVAKAQKGQHRVEETVERAADAVEERARKIAHAAEETLRHASNKVKELSSKASHGAHELVGRPVARTNKKP